MTHDGAVLIQTGAAFLRGRQNPDHPLDTGTGRERRRHLTDGVLAPEACTRRPAPMPVGRAVTANSVRMVYTKRSNLKVSEGSRRVSYRRAM
jgi:hypothetical protein